MEHTEEEKAFIEKEGRRVKEADEMFCSLMEIYKRKKKLKRVHITKNKYGKYPGRTIFADMVSSYTYTEKEKEELFKCLVGMPPLTLKCFEQLYIKSSAQKASIKIELLEDLKNAHKEYLALDTKYGKLLVWKDIALREIKKLDEENALLGSGIDTLFRKVGDYGKKLGKYPSLFHEVDLRIEQSKNNSTRRTKKDIMMSVLKEHIEADDTPELTSDYIDSGENLELYYKNFKSAYYNYVRRKP